MIDAPTLSILSSKDVTKAIQVIELKIMKSDSTATDEKILPEIADLISQHSGIESAKITYDIPAQFAKLFRICADAGFVNCCTTIAENKEQILDEVDKRDLAKFIKDLNDPIAQLDFSPSQPPSLLRGALLTMHDKAVDVLKKYV